MSLPINTREGIEKRIEALEWIVKDDNINDVIKERARRRLRYWRAELAEYQVKEADEYIDFILDGLE